MSAISAINSGIGLIGGFWQRCGNPYDGLSVLQKVPRGTQPPSNAQEDPKLLQQRAKTASDDKVAFVYSDRAAPPQVARQVSPIHSEVQILILLRELGVVPWL